MKHIIRTLWKGVIELWLLGFIIGITFVVVAAGVGLQWLYFNGYHWETWTAVAGLVLVVLYIFGSIR